MFRTHVIDMFCSHAHICFRLLIMFSLLTNSKKHASIWQYFTNSMILFRMTTATFSGRQHSAALCTIYTHTLICTPSYKNRPMYVQLVYRLTSHNVPSSSMHIQETRCTSRAYTTITGRCRRTRINSNESKQNRNNKHSTKEHI